MASTSLPALRDRSVGVKRGQNPNIGVEAAVSKHWGEKRTNPKYWGFPDYYPIDFLGLQWRERPLLSRGEEKRIVGEKACLKEMNSLRFVLKKKENGNYTFMFIFVRLYLVSEDAEEGSALASWSSGTQIEAISITFEFIMHVINLAVHNHLTVKDSVLLHDGITW